MEVIQQGRKIIHIDMDSFYASVEIRDNPSLAKLPVAVGGSGARGVLCTCNYIARDYGVRSAMSSKLALQKCPELLILPVNMAKYQEVSKSVQQIFYQFTDLVEPLSLDEAYLDVTDNPDFQNSATLIAQEIRRLIWETEHLTASAGVAPNKFLAKIASAWNKPNGLFVIPPEKVISFVNDLEVSKIFGVGRVTNQKLQSLGIKTCRDLQKFNITELTNYFGKLGHTLYHQSRGIDNRVVNNNRSRKSLSVETTFLEDTNDNQILIKELDVLYDDLIKRYAKLTKQYHIKSLYVKVKYKDFTVRVTENAGSELNKDSYIILMNKLLNDNKVRLLGLGIRLIEPEIRLGSLFD